MSPEVALNNHDAIGGDISRLRPYLNETSRDGANLIAGAFADTRNGTIGAITQRDTERHGANIEMLHLGHHHGFNNFLLGNGIYLLFLCTADKLWEELNHEGPEGHEGHEGKDRGSIFPIWGFFI